MKIIAALLIINFYMLGTQIRTKSKFYPLFVALVSFLMWFFHWQF